jgi:predicted RNA binding protein YcfA (HicA-like mRNA interferase family)
MSKLPNLSGKDVAKKLEKIGFVFVRQLISHMILRREKPFKMTVTIPDHKELKRGTLKNILRQVGISLDEFLKL